MVEQIEEMASIVKLLKVLQMVALNLKHQEIEMEHLSLK